MGTLQDSHSLPCVTVGQVPQLPGPKRLTYRYWFRFLGLWLVSFWMPLIGTKAAVLPKGRSSNANPGTKVAVLLGMNRSGSFLLLSTSRTYVCIILSMQYHCRRGWEREYNKTLVCFGVGIEFYASHSTLVFVTPGLLSCSRVVQCTLAFNDGNTNVCDCTLWNLNSCKKSNFFQRYTSNMIYPNTQKSKGSCCP